MATEHKQSAGTTTDIPSCVNEELCHRHVTGLKLAGLLASLTLVMYMSMLDTSIIGTVCQYASLPSHLSNKT